LKTLPPFSLNQFCKLILGTALLCPFILNAQESPLTPPQSTEYPGIIQTFEKLIQIDRDKFQKIQEILLKNGRVFDKSSSVKNLQLGPDFVNSIILHSDPGYIRLASGDKCRFYESILTDLLRTSEGKIKNVSMTYVDKDLVQSALMSKKDFLAKVVNEECPETQKSINDFQVRTLRPTLAKIQFEIPSGLDHCRNIHLSWVNNPKTPFLCQIHEYIKEAKSGGGDPRGLQGRLAMAKVLEEKMTLIQKDYIDNLCRNLDDEELFCQEFLNVSFWTKIAAGIEDKIYVEDICKAVLKTSTISEAGYASCLARIKKEKDLCLYPEGNPGMRPQPDCDLLSTALNFSSLKSNFRDCPGRSDQMVSTNLTRILSRFSPISSPSLGSCASISSENSFKFNDQFDNEESWKLEACYDNQLKEREICLKTYFGQNDNDPASYTSVVATILRETRGADKSEKCQMVDAATYNPLLLQYKSGCYIIYENDKCFISECKHVILYNDRKIDNIKIKGRATMAYFPLSVKDERISMNYLLTHDYKKNGRPLNNLSGLTNFLRRSPTGLVHGIGCAEDLLPTFFKAQSLNQCSPLPFIINGMQKEKDQVVFVTRSAADSLQAPRLVSWSSLYSAVKSYQRTHPLRLWTLHGLD
jgi:hypothetical protein